jgi:hypothetical protein
MTVTYSIAAAAATAATAVAVDDDGDGRYEAALAQCKSGYLCGLRMDTGEESLPPSRRRLSPHPSGRCWPLKSSGRNLQLIWGACYSNVRVDQY